MRVLITGAAGRIGSLLAARLPALGWQVTGCDVAGDWHQGDICDLASMARLCAGQDVVMHLAGAPNAAKGWDDVSRLNVEGTRCVLEAARRAAVRRVVHASSIHVVGALPWGTPFGPDLPLSPSGLYGATKIAGEALCRTYALMGLATTAVRICSFRAAPQDAREQVTWLGHDDCVRLFDRAGRDDARGHRMIWGVSRNPAAAVDDPTARDIGYVAKDDPAEYPAPEDRRVWATLGGPVTEATRGRD